MKTVGSFEKAIARAQQEFQELGYLVHGTRWQGMTVSDKPEMATYEVLNHSFSAFMPTEDLDYYRDQVKPNLPWADDHFRERVGGQPLNPGIEWANWPYGKSADRFRDDVGIFTHTYMERYWPTHAGPDHTWEMGCSPGSVCFAPNRGTRYEYGDLADVVTQLAREPDTRQAFLPVFFPEDTGAKHGGRIPCSIGYHFLMRNGYFHLGYWLRSCDFVRHFRDDIYLTVRLHLWVLDRLREHRPEVWNDVKPGMYSMWMTSLHMFRNDYRVIFGKEPGRV